MQWLKNKWLRLRHRLGLGQIEWDMTLDRVFDRLAIMKQEPEQKQIISIRVVEDAKIGWLYWMELTLSVLIATFGLLQNSVAVIIGAMLIAPFLRPIQGVAFAIANGRKKLLWNTLQTLTISTLYSIFLAWLVLGLVPYAEVTPEILSRTAPNTFDLFIAIFSAMVASLAHAYQRLYESVAGVAMATAIVPPLAVIGIMIYFGDFTLAWGSFVLYLTNLVAILLIGVVMFIFYGFNPHKQESESSLKRIAILFLVTFVLWFVLSSGLQKIEANRTLQKSTYQTLLQTLDQDLPGAKIKDFEIIETQAGHTINGQLFIDDQTRITYGKFKDIKSVLSEQLGRDFELELDIVRTVSLEGEE